jgi:hypothetical protein
MRHHRPLRSLLTVAMFCSIPLLAVLTLAARPDPHSRATTVSSETNAQADPCATVKITIGPDVPHDVPGGTRLPATEQSEAELAAFAWQQFLALCWQSDYNTNTHSRGAPDTNWNYTMKYTPGQPLVWETYAHRSELRPYNTPLDSKTPFSKVPTYIFMNQITPKDGVNYFNNLDEDSEIGSCNAYDGPKDPTQGDPKSQPLVLYQAKVNQAEYDYILTAFGEDQYDPAPVDNKKKPIAVYQAPPQGNLIHYGKLYKAQHANIKSIKDNKYPAPDGINLPAGDNTMPGRGGEGAIEIKTAFLLVTDDPDDHKDFFKTKAIYYTADYDANKSPNYSNWKYSIGTFALLGIHVIHKTKSYPDFIFTSFEHKTLADEPFQFILTSPLPPTYPGSNFNPFNATLPVPTPPNSSQIGVRHLIKRQTGMNPTSNGQLYPIPPCLDTVTKTVHSELSKLNPNSIWLNYRLMGVQANITEKWAPTPSEGAGPNHFMANHIIESDAFVGNFFGPGFGTNPFPTGPTGPQGQQNGDNILYKGKTFNMGGCKGCHGVSQTAFGTDFSFLLDFYNNKPVLNPDTIFYHPDEQ